MIKIYIPNTGMVEKICTTLNRPTPMGKAYVYPMTDYNFLKEISEEEFEQLDLSSEERRTGNIIVCEDGKCYALKGEEFIAAYNLKMVNENYYALTERDRIYKGAETEFPRIQISVSFPCVKKTYRTKEVPALNEILNEDFIQEEYAKIFSEKEVGILQIEAKSENEGKRYYYDVVSKTWYFAEDISSLKEDRERYEKLCYEKSLREKKFKKKQIKKVCFLVLFITLMQICLMLNASSDTQSVYFTPAMFGGGILIIFMCFDLLISKIRFDNSGGFFM